MRFPSSVRFETQSLEDAFNEAIKGPLTTDVIQRNYVWPKNRVAGTEQHLALLLDFTVQRMLEGI